MDMLNFVVPFWNENHKLPDPDLLLLYKQFESRDIWLDCEIAWENCSMLVKYIQYLNNTQDFDSSPIHLHILSNGGELDIMFMLYTIIKESRIPIYTINHARCHSAAFVVFLAGQKRFMAPHATFIAHEGSGMVGGTFKETKQAMAQYEKDVHRMASIIAEETNLKIEQIKGKFDADSDWYINYDDAVEYGILKE